VHGFAVLNLALAATALAATAVAATAMAVVSVRRRNTTVREFTGQ
jgi:hypothetical protein